MREIGKILSVLVVGAVAAAGSAFGGTVPITQSITFSPTTTGYQDYDFYNFLSDPNTPEGASLVSVTLEASITQSVTGLSISNTSVGDYTAVNQNFYYSLTGDYGLFGSNSVSGDVNAIIAGTTDGALPVLPANQTLYTIGDGSDLQGIQAGETLTYLPGPPASSGVSSPSPFAVPLLGTGTFTWDSGVIDGTTSAYDTNGTFNLAYGAETNFIFGGGATNLQSALTSNSTATFTVIYNYSVPDSTPEPSTILLMGSALLAAGFYGRRHLRQ